MNLQKLMKQAQEVQERINQMQEKMADAVVEGKAGGGLVSIVINGKGDVKKVTLDAKILVPDEKEVVEDLIIAAFNDAKNKADAQFSEGISSITGGLPLPPGFKLPL